MFTSRLESMSPNGYLELYRQNDGDIILRIGESNGSDGFHSFSNVEFCTPFAGGGGSKRTYAALIQLMAAMAADNLDQYQQARRPPGLDDAEQKRIVEWGRQCKQALAEAEESARKSAKRLIEKPELLDQLNESLGQEGEDWN